jgi:hypothetical protein
MANMSCCSTVPSRQGAELECGPEVGVKRSHYYENIAKIGQGERGDVEMFWLVGARCVQRMNGNGAQKRQMARWRDRYRLVAR